MLLELTRWLEQLQSLFGLFGYLTFRGILSALTALALSLWWGPAMIRTPRAVQGRPADPQRRPADALLQGRHADHGRRADPAHDRSRRCCCGPTCATATSGWCWR